ncbi:OmpA family protein [Streptomyces avidinii]|uniref:Outer membrane protein OmpA-like peptidoglycan-associated protein n=1 Tax=Streptomyces avidinii TaxID=1895 RepID=A0ABS4KW52_STRAV|nr:OmpA family protein [Streptomyces avidinii]MBP2034247.1 outer membrane protein OmpA-like peptidoglycan-associated protein [Streptomyces avidinii]
MSRVFRALLSVPALLGLAVGALTACGTGPAPTALTIAVTASMAEPAPWAPALNDLAVRHALRAVEPGDGAISVVVSTDAQVTEVDLTPLRGPREVEQDPATAREKVLAEAAHLRSALAASRPAAEGLDLLGTYRRALRTTPSGGTVVVVSSGVQTVDPLDVRTLGWDFDPGAVVGHLKGRGLVPDAHGRHVEFIGLGVAYGTQPELPLPAAQRITALWHAVCGASGAASCTVRDDDVPRLPPVSERPVPVVAVAVPRTSCAGTFVVPASVTFAADDARLGAGAERYLVPIADSLRRCPAGGVVRITGHTARVGTAVSGLDLSVRRARAVRDRLIRLGVAPGLLGPAEGAGSGRPLVENMPGGVFSEPLARLNRRVEVTVVSAAPARAETGATKTGTATLPVETKEGTDPS